MNETQKWITVAGVGSLYVFCCHRCKIWSAIPVEIEAIARARPGDVPIYCGNGHAAYFSKGKSEEDKLREERDRLKQEQAWYADRLKSEQADRQLAERRAAAARGQVTKLKNRAAAGVCPCCNRTFTNLQRHMHSQHPGFVNEPDASEHIH